MLISKEQKFKLILKVQINITKILNFVNTQWKRDAYVKWFEFQ
jgi:hypothetical protein